MLSRVAENLYWISRYFERSENVARLLDVSFHMDLDASGAGEPGGTGGLGPIGSVLWILACREAFEREHPELTGDREAVLRFLSFDPSHPHSLLSMVAHARENARATQDALSGETWSHINSFYLTLRGKRGRRRFEASPTRFFDWVKRACLLFTGLIDGTLPRTEAFHFLQLGRYLERLSQVSRILNIKLHGFRPEAPTAEPPIGLAHWSSLLRCCSGYEAYLREHHDTIDPEGVVLYLVLDSDFPRAMRFCVDRCLESLRAISGEAEDGQGFGSEPERLLGRLESDLRYLDVGEIFEVGLPKFLDGIQLACNRIGTEIHQAYFFT